MKGKSIHLNRGEKNQRIKLKKRVWARIRHKKILYSKINCLLCAKS